MPYACWGQQPSTIHLTEKDGLPDIEFYDMLEDGEGFIWFAADKGLFRYDGETFKRYTNDAVRGRSMFELRLDDKGRVWCVNISGQFFYIDNDQLVTFIDLNNELSGELSDYELLGNKLMVFSTLKIIEVDIETTKYIINPTNSIISTKPLLTEETVIFSQNNYIVSYTKDKNPSLKIDISSLFDDSKLKKQTIIKKLVPFEIQGNLYAFLNIKKENVFLKLDFKNNSYKIIKTPERLINVSIVKINESDGQTVFSTSQGAHIYQINEDKFVYKTSYLPKEYVTKVLVDKDNNYWFSTLRSGVFVMPNIYVQRFEIPSGYENISKLEKIDEETVFFGTVEGYLGSFNLVDKTLKTVDFKRNGSVSALLYDQETSKVMAGFDSNGVIYDLKTRTTTPFPPFAQAKSFSLTSKDTLIVVKGNTIGAFDIYDTKNQVQSVFEKKRGYASYQDTITHRTYIATIDNLRVYDANFEATSIRYNNLPILGIDITKTQDGLVWVASFKNGIYVIDNSKVVAHYTKNNGLSANEVTQIESDGNNLWITTDSGVQLFDRKANIFKTLTKKDGIPSFKISGIVVGKGQVVFSSNQGLFAVDKENAFRQATLSDLYIQDVLIDEKSIPLAKSYRLNADQKKIKFDFHTNNFQNEDNILYEYRLLPETTSWTTLNKEVSDVQFSNLPKGKYTLEVRAKNTFSNNYSSIKTIPFITTITIWEELWFQVLLALIAIALVTIYLKSVYQAKQKKQELALTNVKIESQLTALKLENLRSQMNPHFIFNALNSIQEYIILNQRKLASDYLGKFADLVRTYLKHSNKGEITLQEEIDCLEMYLDLEKLRFEEKLEYKIIVDNELSPERISIPTMLIQPYVENAIKHGLLHRKTERRLSVTFYFGNSKEAIICEVEDNGVGRELAGKFQKKRKTNHESFATKATDDRLMLINNNKDYKIGVIIEDLHDLNSQALGTKVIITIPYHKE